MMLCETSLQCTDCGRDGLSRNDFYAAPNKRSGLQRRCKKCYVAAVMATRSNNIEHYKLNQHRRRLQREYGITLEDYDAMLAAQGGGCAGCGQQCRTGRRLAVDHDHKTGIVRGLLCAGCNHVLGIARDNPRTLRTLAQYLEDSER